MSGASSPQAAEVQAAVAAALECSRDLRKFTNQSEVVLARLQQSLQHLRQKRFSDERQIIEAINDKEQVVRFVLDCVRNRFLLWRGVADLKAILVEDSIAWAHAFDRVSRNPPYDSVDLTMLAKGPPPPPPERRPIPFCLEVLALVGVALPLLAVAQGCNCVVRWCLFLLGLLLCLPWSILEVHWRRRHPRLVQRLVVGRYAVNLQRCELGRFWAPSRAFFCSRPPSPEEEAASGVPFLSGGGAASRSATTSQDSALRSCVSFGQWFPCVQKAAPATVEPLGTGSLKVTCDLWQWRAAPATFDSARISLQGLQHGAVFDGNCIFFSPARGPPRVWAKVGCWRLDWLRKVAATLAAFGLVMALAAAFLEPGLILGCIQFWPTTTPQRTPMRAVFLLDASGSISGQSWVNEKQASAELMNELANLYGSDVKKMSVGLAQFSTTATLEAPLTNDLNVIRQKLQDLVQKTGTTEFKAALKICQQQLSPGLAPPLPPPQSSLSQPVYRAATDSAAAPVAASPTNTTERALAITAADLALVLDDGVAPVRATGVVAAANAPAFSGGAARSSEESFDLCILLTDGDSGEDQSMLRRLLAPWSHLLGVYVGTTQASGKRLRELVCGSPPKKDCNMFASATDFSDLREHVRQIAAAVTKGVVSPDDSNDHGCSNGSPWVSLCLLLLLPALFWWCYLRCYPSAPKPREDAHVHRDPVRLRLAGQNEGLPPTCAEPRPASRFTELRGWLGGRG